MKSVKSKFSPRKKKTANSPLTPELNSFNIATEISEHQQQQQQQQQPPQRRSIFNNIRPTSRPSQQSLATHPSFVTAPDTPNSTTLITPAAASYFVDSSDDEDTQHTEESQLKFGNDPLAVLSKQTTPTEITITNDPELTMPSKRTVTKKAAAPAPVIATKVDEPAKFDVAQHVYGFAKDTWGWGKTVPVVSAFLGAAEAVVSEIVKKVLNKDLPAIDSEAVAPNLKKLDDDIVTPTILKCWEIIGPAVGKVDEVAVKPVVTEVLPKVLGIVGMGGKSESEKKAEEKKMMVDHSPTPEVTAFN